MAGYPQIVSLMSQHEELATLRKFGNLSIQNLLFMQAELMHLEERLTRIAAKGDDGQAVRLSIGIGERSQNPMRTVEMNNGR